jgi:ribulose bisphosphate carboxylase small subunit
LNSCRNFGMHRSRKILLALISMVSSWDREYIQKVGTETVDKKKGSRAKLRVSRNAQQPL